MKNIKISPWMPKYHGVMSLRRVRGALVALSLLVPTVLWASPSAAAPAAPAPAAADADLEVLEADEAEIRARIAELKEQRSTAKDQLTEARRWADERRRQLQDAQDEELEARKQANWLDKAARVAAAEAYTGSDDSLASFEVLFSDDLEETSIKSTYLEHRASQRSDIFDEHRRAQADLTDRVAQTQAAADAAEEAEASATAALNRIEDAVAEQQQLLADLDARVERALAEAQALADIDAEAAADIVDDAESLRDEVAQTTPPASDPTPSPRPAPTTGGSSPAPATTTTTTTTPPVSKPPTLPSVSTTTVRGIVVATSIAGKVDSMLGAAQSAGLSISGSGYRDSQRQIELRRAHCGPSNYDIYERPASQCSPPTARPGTSMHEKGLALDLTCGGALIRSRDNACFVWLAANASSYGFYNLPSEPWHWSTNGN